MTGCVRSLSLSLAVCALVAGCSDELGLGIARGVIEAPEVVDFGDVPVGLRVSKAIVLNNAGSVHVGLVSAEIDATELPDGRFTVLSSSRRIAPGQPGEALVEFIAFRAGEQVLETTLVLTTDARENNTKTIRIRARGMADALVAEPNPVEFGAVLTGASRRLEVRLTNRSAYPLPLTSDVDSSGHPWIVNIEGLGRFEVEALAVQGSTRLDLEPLAPMSSTSLGIVYSPNADGDARSRWDVRYCDDAVCGTRVSLNGRGTRFGLDCVPAVVDFGGVNPGAHASRMVTCTNVTGETLNVTGWSLDPISSQVFSVSPSTPVSLAPWAATTIAVDVQLEPAAVVGRAENGRLLVTSSGASRGALPPVEVPLRAGVGGPSIQIAPERVDFGTVALGLSSTRRILVSNVGFGDLVITSIEDEALSTVFAHTETSFTVRSGESQIIEIKFTPDSEVNFTSALILHNNDASNPQARVPLSGNGVDLPPCSYRAWPNPLNFGVVDVGASSVLSVNIENIGQDDCLINDIGIVDSALPTTPFHLEAGPESSVFVRPGGTKTIEIGYRPIQPGTQQGELSFVISDPVAPNVIVPLFGAAEGPPLPQLMCPAATVVLAGNAVTLTAVPSGGAPPLAFSWSVVSAPMGGIGTPDQWTPNPPTTDTVSFLPHIVGVYVIQAQATDTLGRTAICDTQVTAEGHGLRTTLTWDGSGDVDLHVHNAMNTPWFTADDCYYVARTPVWNPTFSASLGPNPTLDFDNVTSSGPENTSIDQPEIGVTYTIGVHNFARAAGRIATIQVYCGGVMSATATFNSRPLLGSLDGDVSGNCNSNDFWKVATVVFSSASTCVVTPIDTYAPSSDACTAL